LIVDDEPAICWTLQEAFRDEGHECLTAPSAEQALELAEKSKFDIILMDVRLPGIDGISAIAASKRIAGDIPILIMTAFGDLDTAVRAVDHGAFDYLIKPFELDHAINAIQQALAHSKSSLADSDTNAIKSDPYRIVGSSPEMQRLFHKIALIARSDAPVMITGESGTGKELVARAIHTHSSRKSQPFLAANMAAFSHGLMERELFGNVKGAFTGANEETPGLFQQARGGTLFLDEIGDLPVEMQVKLLRVLENQEVLPVGSSKPVRIDVRIVAATNQPIAEFLRQGKIREDFYFRLNVFQIRMPPLRERMADFDDLVMHFLSTHSPGISDEALNDLKSRDWPGNVRQLKNAVEHAAILARNRTIRPEHLPTDPLFDSNVTGGSGLDQLFSEWLNSEMNDENPNDLYERFLARFEPLLLKQVMSRYQDHKQPSARALGLHRATLRQMLRKYRLVEE
jgi:two-component system nitrogen regulation response regulator GlnG